MSFGNTMLGNAFPEAYKTRTNLDRHGKNGSKVTDLKVSLPNEDYQEYLRSSTMGQAQTISLLSRFVVGRHRQAMLCHPCHFARSLWC